MDWFLYDNGLLHERVKTDLKTTDDVIITRRHALDKMLQQHNKTLRENCPNLECLSSLFSLNAGKYGPEKI